MMLCPARQILKRPDEAITAEPLVFGTLMHWRIEQYWKHRSVSFERLMQALHDVYFEDTNGGDILEVLSKKAMRQLCVEVDVAMEAWDATVLPKLPLEQPIIEGTMRIKIWDCGGDIDDTQVMLTGTPDAVFPEAKLIVDWKTAGRNWDAVKVDGQIQPWAYATMAQHAGIDVDEFHFWVYDRSTESWWCHRHSLVNFDEASKALKTQAAGFALMVDAGVPIYTPAGSGYKARGWHCSPQYCDQWGHCDGKYLVADGQATLPALDSEQKGWK